MPSLCVTTNLFIFHFAYWSQYIKIHQKLEVVDDWRLTQIILSGGAFNRNLPIWAYMSY